MRQNRQPSTAETVPGSGLSNALDDLERWAAEARAREAADERVRARWARRAAEEGATFAGVLLDLAEAGIPTTLTTTGGHRHGGRLIVVGADFVAVRTGTGLVVLLALAGLAEVVAAGVPGGAGAGRPASGEDRPQPLEVTLADVLARLAVARPRASLRAGEAVVSGELVATGSDVVTVSVGGSHPARLAYVRLASVSEVTVFDAG